MRQAISSLSGPGELRPGASGAAGSVLPALVPEPFLHVAEDRVYNPLTDVTLQRGEAGYDELRAALAGGLVDGEQRAALVAAGWLIESEGDPAIRFRLKYVSLEAHTVCNQACFFCPVSVAPREGYFMPTDLYERIVGELAAYRHTIAAVYMINYNEPTVDRRFVEQVRAIKEAGLPPSVLTNGTGLTPERVDALVAMGGLRYLSINLSTLDAERYGRDRGGNRNQLKLVLRNLDHAGDLAVAEQMEIVVLGVGDDAHRRDHAEISARFAGTRFTVKLYEVMDRAGYLPVGLKPRQPLGRLAGCENVGSRPLQHLHITPRGVCVLCCEDYDERYVVGDLARQSVAEVLGGPQLALLRRWAYGLADAPADFICRKCVFARGA